MFQKKELINSILQNKTRKAVPILTTLGISLIGKRADEVFQSGELEFEAIAAQLNVSPEFRPDIAVTFMDLSVEAEAFGAPLHFPEDGTPVVQSAIVHDRDSVEQLKVPSVGFSRTKESIFCACRCVEKLELPTFCGMIGPLSLAGRLLDMTELMCLLASDPETVHLLLEKVSVFLGEYLKAFKATGAAGVIIAEPAAGLVSPRSCQAFSADYLKKIIEPVLSDDFVVVLHNCGKTTKQVKQLLSTGCDALHIGNAVAITDILDQVPADIPVMGNLNPVDVIKDSTPDEVYAQTSALLKTTSGYPNFVLSTGCDVPHGVAEENIFAFYRAKNDYNKQQNL